MLCVPTEPTKRSLCIACRAPRRPRRSSSDSSGSRSSRSSNYQHRLEMQEVRLLLDCCISSTPTLSHSHYHFHSTLGIPLAAQRLQLFLFEKMVFIHVEMIDVLGNTKFTSSNGSRSRPKRRSARHANTSCSWRRFAASRPKRRARWRRELEAPAGAGAVAAPAAGAGAAAGRAGPAAAASVRRGAATPATATRF